MMLRVGTRTSALALAQAEAAAAQIVEIAGLDGYEIIGITTKGDVSRKPLHTVGGSGLFTGAVREALAAGKCDVVVHSSKDLPAALDPRFAVIYPPRENPADVLCSRMPLAELPAGSRVGTGSPRRAAQLLAMRPDLVAVPIRGNVPTRLAAVGEGCDAVILARAGLNRLGIFGDDGVVFEELPVETFVPAAGQGALGIEAAAGSWAAQAARVINDPRTEMEVSAERAFMAAIGAGCTTPVGVLGRAQMRDVPNVEAAPDVAKAENSGPFHVCVGASVDVSVGAIELHARYCGAANFSLECGVGATPEAEINERVRTGSAAEAAQMLAARFRAAGIE
ncbi:hydroxymethylbilane synthase [Arcanobacterium wilhelmae]|uniref:Hydroxymethylbilane synthase n=1 Tax=Arcanobacterium wilhelmae TaxID=1803177 RepID=A0ABT9NB94_9ACTO|nr:hydroxymethylbilane synthase [Arcanobacterium wilhelmae]MDP9800989.1 hydroxymethylbilane synthase [Arcanobacterium wilhelmae]WFN90349.1 hydroxymethylbilane synthase [Arcanobacterium wilhelmae]